MQKSTLEGIAAFGDDGPSVIADNGRQLGCGVVWCIREEFEQSDAELLAECGATRATDAVVTKAAHRRTAAKAQSFGGQYGIERPLAAEGDTIVSRHTYDRHPRLISQIGLKLAEFETV